MNAFILWFMVFMLYLLVWRVVKLYKEDKVGEFFTMMCIVMLPILTTVISKVVLSS